MIKNTKPPTTCWLFPNYAALGAHWIYPGTWKQGLLFTVCMMKTLRLRKLSKTPKETEHKWICTGNCMSSWLSVCFSRLSEDHRCQRRWGWGICVEGRVEIKVEEILHKAFMCEIHFFLIIISRAHLVCVNECACVCIVHGQLYMSGWCMYAGFSIFQFSCMLKNVSVIAHLLCFILGSLEACISACLL